MVNTQLVNEMENVFNTLSQAAYSYQQYTRKLSGLYSSMVNGRITKDEYFAIKSQIYNLFEDLINYNTYFGNFVNKFNKQIGPKFIAQLQSYPTRAKAQILTNDLIKLADALDKQGYKGLANKIDNFLKNASELTLEGLNAELMDLRKLVFGLIERTNRMEQIQQKKSERIMDIIKLAEFSDTLGAHLLANELDIIAEEELNSNPIQPPNEGHLSTRYCPDHNGTQATRVSERIYQCPIDGKVYNYEIGYKNYQGQRVPGGSISAQTPTTSNYGGIPMRVYDSRQSILNRIN